MKKSLIQFIITIFFSSLVFAQSNLIITGVLDGPIVGGLPKFIELYVFNDISDLSIYGVGLANNGGGTDGEEFTFPAVAATAGTYIYIASETIEFTNFMGFAPDYTSSAANNNGDDAVELFQNSTVVDVFGEINVDGTGQPWDYLDGWVYRVNGTGPDGSTFVLANWSFSGINALDGELTNSTAATPFPTGTYLHYDGLIITGVIDGPLTGGVPKGVELYALGDIADLSIYGLGAANNGGGTDGEEFTFPAVSATAGTYIYIASETIEFTNFMGFAPDYTSGYMSINGDDAIELFQNSIAVDVFGEISVDGTGQPWDYLDGWAYRVDGTGPDGSTFVLANWSFSGINALDGELTNATATTPFPIGTYSISSSSDTAPSVFSTTPTNSATSIAGATNIDINFNEDVSVTGAWYTISGASSGAHTAFVTGGPSTFTLNPDADFTTGEVVTVTISAAQVTDQDSDDPPDNMSADYVFSFTILSSGSGWIINELLADPAGDITGDANGDGTRDSGQDEFVEIINTTGGSVDMSGWTIADGYSVRHTFPTGSVVPDQSAIIVFGGGTPTGTFGYALVQTASTGSLGLNNSGDTITLNDGTSDVAVYAYGSEGGYDQSLTRDPDITGLDPLIKHSIATGSGGTLFSPGTMINGSPFPGAVIPVLWVINEFLADPAGDITGDANGDGTRDSGQDEFVEIINTTGGSVDISGWTIADGYTLRHTFPAGSVVPDQSAIIIFGGGTPTGTFGYAIIQTASTGSLGLNNSGDTITLNDGTSDVVVYAYGSEGGYDQSLTRDPDITGLDPLIKHSTATGSGGTLFSPGTMINGSPFPGAVIPPPVLEIFDIQGSGLFSPYDGQIVTTESNVVTAISSDGFFIQTPTARSDADISTSDGILVYTGSAPTITVGDLVNVTGKVKEFYEFTEIEDVTFTIIGTGIIPDPVVFDELLPSPNQPVSTIEFERFESMLITISDGTVTESNQHFGSDPIAEVYIVAGSDRIYREPGIEYPGSVVPTIPVWDGNPEVFELDPNKLGLTNITIHAGSSFEATGVLGYEYSGYEFWPFELTVDESTLPIAVPDRVLGEFTVGSLNLYRLYASYSDYTIRLSKFSLYIRNVLNAPDILAVQEVNDIQALEGLAAKIMADDGSVIYDAYLEEGNDIGGIDVGFLVRSDRVQVDAITQLGKDETYVDPSDGSVDILHDRPPLLLEGSFIVDPTTFYPIAVMAVHNRSLNGIETIRVQTKRLTQAQSIAEKVQALQDADPDVHLVVTGDFNAFEFTDGYVDAVGHIVGDFDPTESVLSGIDLVEPNLTNQVLGLAAEDRYSYAYRGSAQVLDHALTSVGLEQAITGFAYGRGNSDAAVNYLYDGTSPLRSSDHDGLVLYIDATPPEIIFNDPITLWPVNHKYTKFDISDFVSAIVEDGVEIPIESAYIVKVTSDEAEDADGTGDGETNNDIKIVNCQTVKLRAEREGTGNGRVYTVYLAVENDGYFGYGAVQVGVPHDKKDTAIDDGAVYEVLSDCETQNELGKILDNSGTENVSDINAIPNDFALNQNFPNPFNPITTINYQLPEPSNVLITIYDISGRKVRELINGFESAGYKSVMWNGRNDNGQMVSGGLYIYHLKTGNYSRSQKMLLMK